MAFPTTVDTIVDAPPFSANTLGHASQVLGPQRITVGPAWINVMSDQYGGTFDGVTDVTTALNSAYAAAQTAGARVYHPPAVYPISLSSKVVKTGTAFCGLIVRPNTEIFGSGRGSTIFKLANSQPGRTANPNTVVALMTHWAINETAAANIDPNITLRDFALNGNSTNQTDTHNGIQVGPAQYFSTRGVLVQDVRGTSIAGDVGETYCYLFSTGSDFWFDDCIALQSTSGNPVANGFGILFGPTNVHMSRCLAAGIKGAASGLDGIGFNVSTGIANAVLSDCHVISSGQGFHLENTFGVNSPSNGPITFLACTAGVVAATASAGHFFVFPYASGGSLGNLNNGWQIGDLYNDISLIGCKSNNNGANGLQMPSTVFGNNKRLEIIGGEFRNNGVAGINLANANAAGYLKILGHPSFQGNTTAAYQAGGTNFAIPGVVTAPAVPASASSFGNPFPFDCDVYITPGTSTCTVAIDNSAEVPGGTPTTLVTLPASGTTPVPFRLLGGSNYAIRLTYTNAPTWAWHAGM